MRENLSALEVEISELKAKRLGAVAHAENAERERIRQKSPKSAMHGQNNRVTLESS